MIAMFVGPGPVGMHMMMGMQGRVVGGNDAARFHTG
jgi:hypothetical protein